MKLCTCMTKSPEVRYHDEDCAYRQDVIAGGTIVPMTIHLRIPLKIGTKYPTADELARAIVDHLKEETEEGSGDMRDQIEEVYYSVDLFKGNDLGV